MGGIVFFCTSDLASIKSFYLERLGCRLWLDQGDCLIFRHGNLLIGFMSRSRVDRTGLITFFYPEKADVDGMYARFEDEAYESPRRNDKYRIYHFFAEDPEGRTLEFQCFDHALPPI